MDVLGTLALLSKDNTRPGVSVDINVSYLAGVKEGEKLLCKGTVLKTGRTLGFTSVEIRRASDGVLVVAGRHTKAL